MCALLVVALLWATPAPAIAAADPLARGRHLTRLFYERELGRLWEKLGPQLRSVLGGPEGLARFRRRTEAQLGAELRVVEEDVSREGVFTAYTRTATFERAGDPFQLVWTFDDAGVALGLSIRPLPAAPTGEAPSRHLGRTTRTPLRLPFEGEWTVFWGGRTLGENRHAATADQRFALDLVVTRSGATRDDRAQGNGSYRCWGLPILAPGAGLVVAAADGVADNPPGAMNRRKPLGNHVVIDHMNGEYSFLAHLRRGSVAVALGQEVASGQRVGECGNSGNSSEPHLHYHLQDSSEFGAGAGLPAQFLDYFADGVPIERGEPTRGQIVQPGE